MSFGGLVSLPLLMATALWGQEGAAQIPELRVPVGTPVSRVVTMADPEQSYALYLPSSFDPSRKWPLLFCFDPRQNGMVPLELFRESAERLGYLIASSNNFRSDTGTAEAYVAIAAIWNDAMARLPVDLERVYSTGFSGGSRISWSLDQQARTVQIAGIIGVGAGLPWPEFPKDWDSERIAYYGLVGETDFNHYEMRTLDERLDQTSIPHRIVSFEGGHRWAPKAACNRALDWMHLQSMRSKLVEVDKSWLDEIYRDELRIASELESQGLVADARVRYGNAARDFEWAMPVEEALREFKRLESDKAVRNLLKKREKERSKALNYQNRASSIMARLRSPLVTPIPTVNQLAFDMGLKRLLKNSQSEDREERLAAQRVLESIFIEMAFYSPEQLKQVRDYERATRCLDLAVMVKPQSPFVWLSLARIQALSGRPGEAVKSLDEAVRTGLSRPEMVEGEPDFESLRGRPEYQELLDRLRSPSGS